MKKKIFCMGLGLLSVILTLAACSQASSSTAAITSTSSTTNVMTSATPATSQTALTTTNVTTSKPPTTASDLPQYGGTLTIFPYQGQNNMGQNFAALQGGSAATQAIMPWIAMLLTGDIDKYGPRGNNAFTFQLNQFVPNFHERGCRSILGAYRYSTDFPYSPGCYVDWQSEHRHGGPGIYCQ